MLAKVFNKGQIVIPAMLRKKYGIKIGDRVNIVEDEDGIKIIPFKNEKSIETLAGIFSEYAGRKTGEEDINSVTEAFFVESFKNEVY
jgi:AbrB family looped-hinge helix DNA binding protein